MSTYIIRKDVCGAITYPWIWHKDGRCRKCKKPRTKKGHDPCIADLPGVLYACCGHGQGDAYVMFVDGRILRGQFDG